MVPSTVFIFVILFAISHCSTIVEPESEPSSKVPEVPSSTDQPKGTTRGPHTHDEHPANDHDHSDHTHEEEVKAAKTSEDDHEHPGHDHSETGHSHEEDHLEGGVKPVDGEKSNPPKEMINKEEEPVKVVGEESGNRAKRGAWRRRLD